MENKELTLVLPLDKINLILISLSKQIETINSTIGDIKNQADLQLKPPAVSTSPLSKVDKGKNEETKQTNE